MSTYDAIQLLTKATGRYIQCRYLRTVFSKNKIKEKHFVCFVLAAIAGCEMVHGGFAVRNLLGQRVFGAEEDTDCFTSTCLCSTPVSTNLSYSIGLLTSW